MSQDLFAAFGDVPAEGPKQQTSHVQAKDSWDFSAGYSATPPPAQPSEISTSQLAAGDDDFGDDDFGDFEDAPAPAAVQVATATSAPPQAPPQKTPAAFPPKAQKRESPPPTADSKVGRHPFADHMDFLFEPGEDEYDAGADDLDNLANNPEAAMAYSKQLIAEQQARSKDIAASAVSQSKNIADSAISRAHQVAAEQRASAKKASESAIAQSQKAIAEQEQRKTKLTKPNPGLGLQIQTAKAPNPPPARNKLRKKSGYTPAKDPDVLFDADNLSEHDEDDDWGDFEDGKAPVVEVIKPSNPLPKQESSAMPAMDLLGLDDNLKPITQIGRSRSDSLRKADTILGPMKKSNHSRSSSLIDDNAWDDFVPQPPAPPVAIPTPIVESNAPEDDAWDDFEAAEPAPKSQHMTTTVHTTQPSISSTSHSRTTSESALPPTNIPPPAILLSVFPSIFSSATDALFTPLSRLDNLQRQQLLTHPATHQFLRGYLEMAIVLARIIAGRKQRWKRDQILSQSMRIGQAGAGGKSGMKLAGVDRGEATKEEQEASEAIRLWRAQAGKLKGIVTTAALTSSDRTVKLPPIPEIAEQMPIKTLKAVEGGFTAPHACALCGLKREERIAKVDVEVDDSFGEWWVQGMDMHVACRNWWDEHNKKLKSR